LDPSAELDGFLSSEDSAEAFWSKVKTNLQAGKIRLIFVADFIPPELRRIVEFLNAQMDPAEVLALEIKQYVGEGLQTLVPRVIGQTAEAEKKKSVGRGAGKRWDEASFFAEVESRNGASVTRVTHVIFEWARSKGQVSFGTGQQSGSIQFSAGVDGVRRNIFVAYTYGTIEMIFQSLKYGPPFDDERKRKEFLERLNAIDGINLPEDAIQRRPSLKISLFVQPDRLQQFLHVLEWALTEIRTVGPGGQLMSINAKD